MREANGHSQLSGRLHPGKVERGAHHHWGGDLDQLDGGQDCTVPVGASALIGSLAAKTGLHALEDVEVTEPAESVTGGWRPVGLSPP